MNLDLSFAIPDEMELISVTRMRGGQARWRIHLVGEARILNGTIRFCYGAGEDPDLQLAADKAAQTVRESIAFELARPIKAKPVSTSLDDILELL